MPCERKRFGVQQGEEDEDVAQAEQGGNGTHLGYQDAQLNGRSIEGDRTILEIYIFAITSSR